MGLLFRKSIKLGPLKINLSKSGIGYSIGNKRIRYTKTCNGKSYNTIKLFKNIQYRTKTK